MRTYRINENVVIKIDDSDLEIMNSFEKWHIKQKGKQVLVCTNTKYQKNVTLIQLIGEEYSERVFRKGKRLEVTKQMGFPLEMSHYVSDMLSELEFRAWFRDGDFYNYQRDNLVFYSPKNRHHITTSHEGSTSRYKGVHWSSKQGLWVSKIQKGERVFYLGGFLNEEKAAIAYNEAAIELFGVNAYQNPICEDIGNKGKGGAKQERVNELDEIE